MTFTRAHKGAYMDLLMGQFNEGHLSLADVIHLLGPDFDLMWESKLKAKFIQDEAGRFYNVKLEEEISKRRNFTQSRKKNLSHKGRHMKTHMEGHMENENENEDKNEKKGEGVQGERCHVKPGERAKPGVCVDGDSRINPVFDQLGSFEEFFGMYRNKAKKSRALRVWCETVQNASMARRIIAALEKYNAHLDSKKWKDPQDCHNWLAEWPDWENFEVENPEMREALELARKATGGTNGTH